MTIPAPRWNLSNVYPSLESAEFRAAVEDYKNKLSKTDSKTKAKELAPWSVKPLTRSIKSRHYLPPSCHSLIPT